MTLACWCCDNAFFRVSRRCCFGSCFTYVNTGVICIPTMRRFVNVVDLNKWCNCFWRQKPCMHTARSLSSVCFYLARKNQTAAVSYCVVNQFITCWWSMLEKISVFFFFAMLSGRMMQTVSKKCCFFRFFVHTKIICSTICYQLSSIKILIVAF